MTENMKKFLELASKDGKDYIENFKKADKDGIIAMAAEKGITLTDADFPQTEGEVSLDDADAVAGGKECWCAVGGGGTGGGYDDTCACVGFGIGQGETYWGSEDRCCCLGGGSGVSTNDAWH